MTENVFRYPKMGKVKIHVDEPRKVFVGVTSVYLDLIDSCCERIFSERTHAYVIRSGSACYMELQG